MNAQNINWFPGHMKKAERMMEESLPLVDAVIEVRDARIPLSSRNPDIDTLAAGKPRMVVMNRTDLADPALTKRWNSALKKEGFAVLETDCRSGKGVAAFDNAARELLREKIERYAAAGQAGRKLRFMVLGIPNVGKSSLINRLAGRRVAEASDRPGVTRGKQWISLPNGMQLLDTPGILWPKLDTPDKGLYLAWTGAVNDEVYDREEAAALLMERLYALYPAALEARYKITGCEGLKGWEILELAARKRGFVVSGGEPDSERMSRVLLDEFRGGKLGRITLEVPE